MALLERRPHPVVEPLDAGLVHLRPPGRIAHAGVQREEVVGVGPALPEERGRELGAPQRDNRVRDELLPPQPFRRRDVGAELLKRPVEALLLFEGARPAVLLLEPHADGHHRAERGEEREARVAHDHDHRTGEDERGEHGDDIKLRRRRNILRPQGDDGFRLRRTARPRRAVEGRGRRRCQIGQRTRGRGGRLGERGADAEDSAADQDGGRPGEQLALCVDAATIDDGAVRRTAVADSHPVPLERQSAMAPGGALGVERNIGLRGAPDHELAVVQDGHDAADGLATGERDAPPCHPGKHATRLRGDERPLQKDEVAQFGRRCHGHAVHEEPLPFLQTMPACRPHEFGDGRRRSPSAQLDRLAPTVDIDHHPHSGLPWSCRA
ncbi:glucose-6-phosphate isomerase [Leifsonia xyli subsp. cynodontis DSM 46306]|uniref:Uncharacterized protein n=1 Tax=Leifsonia xyli subsp. cynodontis DSM 46306 TaxID=1389489 RepID=U3PBQ8_LEIXC|nr:glucose-6-phosphate isomerase [Leifsonia xyli subsp. cynodontis DSM 46306]